MRLIDADALHDDIVDSYMTLHKFYEAAQDEQAIKNMTAQLVAFAEFAMRVKATPTIDAEPVVHGYWIEHHDDSCSLFNGWECSECKQIVSGGRGNGCPNCRAKMDAEPKPPEPRKICPATGLECIECVPGYGCAKIEGGARDANA